MTLIVLKQSIHESVDRLNDRKILEMVSQLVADQDQVFQIPKEHLEGIEQGINDIKNGDFITLAEFKKI